MQTILTVVGFIVGLFIVGLILFYRSQKKYYPSSLRTPVGTGWDYGFKAITKEQARRQIQIKEGRCKEENGLMKGDRDESSML